MEKLTKKLLLEMSENHLNHYQELDNNLRKNQDVLKALLGEEMFMALWTLVGDKYYNLNKHHSFIKQSTKEDSLKILNKLSKAKAEVERIYTEMVFYKRGH